MSSGCHPRLNAAASLKPLRASHKWLFGESHPRLNAAASLKQEYRFLLNPAAPRHPRLNAAASLKQINGLDDALWCLKSSAA